MKTQVLKLAFLCLCLLSGFASAAKIVISAEGESQLELRTIMLPDGSEVEYVVLSGNPVTLKIDETQEIIANYIEFDRTNKVVRIVGYGTIITEDQRTDGDNLVFELEDETFVGKDVLIITDEIDVIGVDANRVPGQISVVSGEFSPCSRCGQTVQDYSFRAGHLELYPGDRLVAFDVDILFRGIPLLFLPLLVVPLGPPDRQPQLTINAGTETTRAEVFLSWPYVTGPNALGNVSLRYYADVEVGAADFFTNTFLGGAILTQYLGGEINHRFYTPTATGRFDLAYTPAFITNRDTGEKSDELYKVRFQFDTEESLDIPQLNLSLSRDDDSLNRIAEINARIRDSFAGLNATLSYQNFIDFDTEDTVREPSFGQPRRSFDLDLIPETESFTLGPFIASGLRLNLGFFEALSNNANRSAATSRTQDAGRILETHNIRLEPLKPWAGLELNASTLFAGQYYTTGERLINWNTSASATQSFGIGSFSLNFERTINEGETPFAFDARNLGNTSSLGGDLTLTPVDWLRFNTNTRYVLLNDRSREAEGFDPLNTSLTLFSNLSWINLSFSNSYDFEEETFDPGNLKTEFSLRYPEPDAEASLSVTLTNDLDPNYPDRLGTDNDQSELDISMNFGVRPYLVADMSGGYTFDPLDPEEGKNPAFRKDLNLGVTFGTPDQQDFIPSLRIGLVRDLNNAETKSLNLTATASVQPVEISLDQNFDVINETLGTSNYSVRWNNIAELSGSGFALIQPDWLGLELKADRSELWQVSLAEHRTDGNARWNVRYESTRAYGATSCSNLTSDSEFKVCDSKIIGLVNLDETRLGAFYFDVDFDATFILADDNQPLNYLRDANLLFFTDIASTVGIQGNLIYKGTASEAEVTQSNLEFNNFAVTAKFFDQLYLSALIKKESWTLVNTQGETSFNLQPEFSLIWDRCCWALYSTWDSQTGRISITLTTPGATEGLGGVFEDTPLRLPGDTPDGTSTTGGS